MASRSRLTSVAADCEIGASAGKRHDVGFFRRPADDLAELTDHCFGEGISCRDTFDHDRAAAKARRARILTPTSPIAM
jgi:hypothetical protein